MTSTLKAESTLATADVCRPTLGIVGCGNIGGRQAANFLACGYDVCVYDINPEPLKELSALGARVTQSAAELATLADVVFTALPTPDDVVRAVLDGDRSLSRGLQAGSIYIDITTNSPATVLKLHEAMTALGVEMLDAPFNDCPVGAKSEHGMGLAILASGRRATFEGVQSLLQLMADRVLYCGEIGCGTQCKLIHNAVNAVAVQAVSEGITLGLARGIALPVIWDALRLGAFGQNAGDIHGLPHYWFSRRCDDPSQHPAFTVKLLHKDIRLARELARECDIPIPHIELTARDYEEAERRGWSYHAASKVRCLQEARAGVIAAGSPPPAAGESPPATAEAVASVAPAAGDRQNGLQRGFSLGVVSIAVLASNLLQLGLQWWLHGRGGL